MTVLLLAAAVAISACRRPDAPPGDDGGSVHPRARPSARLPQPVSYYVNNRGGEFQRLVAALYFGGGVVDSSESAGGAGAVRVRVIEALADAHTFRPDTAGNGVVIARLRNLGPGRDLNYGMQPDASAEYYIVVTPDTVPGQGLFALYQLRKGKGATLRPVTANGEQVRGVFRPCNGGHPKWSYGVATFGSCEKPDHPDTVAIQTATPRARASLNPFRVREAWAQGFRGIGWASCDAGCCEYAMRQ